MCASQQIFEESGDLCRGNLADSIGHPDSTMLDLLKGHVDVSTTSVPDLSLERCSYCYGEGITIKDGLLLAGVRKWA